MFIFFCFKNLHSFLIFFFVVLNFYKVFFFIIFIVIKDYQLLIKNNYPFMCFSCDFPFMCQVSPNKKATANKNVSIVLSCTQINQTVDCSPFFQLQRISRKNSMNFVISLRRNLLVSFR